HRAGGGKRNEGLLHIVWPNMGRIGKRRLNPRPDNFRSVAQAGTVRGNRLRRPYGSQKCCFHHLAMCNPDNPGTFKLWQKQDLAVKDRFRPATVLPTCDASVGTCPTPAIQVEDFAGSMR